MCDVVQFTPRSRTCPRSMEIMPAGRQYRTAIPVKTTTPPAAKGPWSQTLLVHIAPGGVNNPTMLMEPARQ